MAQIFISYKREDRHLTEDLARDLEALSYSVWWDTRLVSGDDIDEVIVDAIDAALAAIVIWTRNSIGSKWVRSEARRADRQGKLIPVRVPELDVNDVPPPFDGYHTDLVFDRERINTALRRLGIVPGNDSQASRKDLGKVTDSVAKKAPNADVAVTEAQDAIAQKARERGNPERIGGRYFSIEDLHKMQETLWSAARQSNSEGAIKLLRAALPVMIEIEQSSLARVILSSNHDRRPQWRSEVVERTRDLFLPGVLDKAIAWHKKKNSWWPF